MGSEFEVLPYHSNIRWSSWEKVLNRVLAMCVERALFLREHQYCHADCFENSEFILILVYMANIFDALNHLNQQVQNDGVNVVEVEENLKAFQKNIPVPGELKQAIAMHLDELTKSLDEYFPTRELYPASLRQPWPFGVATADVNNEYLDEIIELQQSQVQQQLFRTTTLSAFWCHHIVTYPLIQSFSRMVDVKTKKRNRLCCENDMRVALAKVKSSISELVSERQHRMSH
ncbi:hypothetical protein GDO78_004722 [Eleutherodactylus coqui]|uniref:Uncharacterized protein n=1 Tax=Eleutherodactylus coqui TaxID=57060 RepID=A0A8J6ERM2_ELECQ|nr:hypothetical protein GDO78_004722 [Eleutherodactylus coqui]